MAVKFQKIKIGDKGTKVKECQKQLKAAGSGLKVDGVFGIGTLSAVRAFPQKCGLPVTGDIDIKTFNRLAAVKPAKTTTQK